METSRYEKIVSDKIEVEAFKYLKDKIKSKGSKIEYDDRFQLQNYLKPNKVFTFQEQIKLFSYRSEIIDISLKYLK